MASEALYKTKVQYLYRDVATHSPAAANTLTSDSYTSVELDLTDLAQNAAEQSDQIDLGTTRPTEFNLTGAIEWHSPATAPTAGGTVDFYWAGSEQSTAANGNPGKVAGASGAYTGDGGGTVDESVQQLDYIGSFVATDLLGIQIADIGTFSPKKRYGTMVVVNKVDQTICDTDAIETSILMVGVVYEGQ